MKKPLLYISDFDGTMTLKDFYHLFTESHLKELDAELLARYKKREITSFEYLAEILAAIDHDESDLIDAMNRLPVDPMVKPVFDLIRNHGGDCAVVSAGADYYIEPILKKIGLDWVTLYANQGTYEKRGIRLSPPKEEQLFSPLYGIAKDRVVEKFRDQYETILFAGDGTADYHPARLADVRFAKSVLAFRLQKATIPFHPFKTYDDIHSVLKTTIFNGK